MKADEAKRLRQLEIENARHAAKFDATPSSVAGGSGDCRSSLDPVGSVPLVNVCRSSGCSAKRAARRSAGGWPYNGCRNGSTVLALLFVEPRCTYDVAGDGVTRTEPAIVSTTASDTCFDVGEGTHSRRA
jgi:hypothetical protein